MSRKLDYILIPVRGPDYLTHAVVSRIDWRVQRYSWFINGNGYAKRSTRKASKLRKGCSARSIQLHHEVMRFDDGCEGELVVDHLNGDRLDCRRENLQIIEAKLNNGALVVDRKNGHRDNEGPDLIERRVIYDEIAVDSLPPF